MVSGASQRRKAHAELENKLECWLLELRLTERSIKLFPHPDTQSRLTSSVLRMVGTDVANSIFSYATSADGSSPVEPKQITAEVPFQFAYDACLYICNSHFRRNNIFRTIKFSCLEVYNWS